jgi:hypothetical protein
LDDASEQRVTLFWFFGSRSFKSTLMMMKMSFLVMMTATERQGRRGGRGGGTTRRRGNAAAADTRRRRDEHHLKAGRRTQHVSFFAQGRRGGVLILRAQNVLFVWIK